MKNNLPNYSTSSRGFTLVELMIVMAVIAVLATMVLFGLRGAQASARDASRQQIMTGVQVALEDFYSDYQAYPSQASFDGMYLAMTSGGLNYMSQPTDPQKSCATPPTSPGKQWLPCSPTAVPAYSYGSPDAHCPSSAALPNGYELTLAKESGGSSYFCSPN